MVEQIGHVLESYITALNCSYAGHVNGITYMTGIRCINLIPFYLFPYIVIESRKYNFTCVILKGFLLPKKNSIRLFIYFNINLLLQNVYLQM